MLSSHSAFSIASRLIVLLEHYQLEGSFGNAITDNASENAACLKIIAQQLGINTKETPDAHKKRHVRCIGYIINLVAHQVLFNSDIEAFEDELESNVTAEIVELASWRNKGPIGRLHNLIRYITHSTQRRNVFLGIQQTTANPLRDHPESSRGPLELITDNLTRWNSWFDAAVRACDLRHAIDEFC